MPTSQREPHRFHLFVAFILSLVVAGCSDDGANFSQYPGFAEWYAAHPPRDALPTATEAALLMRHRPRVFLPDGHEGPIDFYRDYIASGRLLDGEGHLISTAVTSELLNEHKRDPAVVFEHQPGDSAPEPVIYGRIEHDELTLPGCAQAVPVTFLSYHLVFRHSGLPAGLPGWQAAGLGLVGDLDDWHQLDHYTAVTLALAPDGAGVPTPLAATFQQHNYMRTYLLGSPDGPGRLVLPADGRLAVDVAIRSNELYPHQPARTRRRAVSFLSPESAGYLVNGDDPPWLAADDVTDPASEIEPKLVFLPSADAFYVFQGWLGERRRLPGRDGPPGADYNTLPAFKDQAAQLAVFYWHEGDLEYLNLLADQFANGRPRTVALAQFAQRIGQDLERACG